MDGISLFIVPTPAPGSNIHYVLENLASICDNLEYRCQNDNTFLLLNTVDDFLASLEENSFIEMFYLNPKYLVSVADGVTRFPNDEKLVVCAKVISDIIMNLYNVNNSLESFEYIDLANLANSFSRLCETQSCVCKEAILVIAKVIKTRDFELETCSYNALYELAYAFTKCNHSGSENVWFKEAVATIAKAVIAKEHEDWRECSHKGLAHLAFSFSNHREQGNEDILKRAVEVIAKRANILFEENNIPDYDEGILNYYGFSFLCWFKEDENDLHFKLILRNILIRVAIRFFTLNSNSVVTDIDFINEVAPICSKLRYEDEEHKSVWKCVIRIANIVNNGIYHRVDYKSKQNVLATLIDLFSKWWNEDDIERSITRANESLIKSILRISVEYLAMYNPSHLACISSKLTLWVENDKEGLIRKAAVRIAKTVVYMNGLPNSNLMYYKLDDLAHICRGFSAWRDDTICSFRNSIKTIARLVSEKQVSYFENCEITSFTLLLESFMKLNKKGYKECIKNAIVTIAIVLLRSYKNQLQHCNPSTLYTLTFCFTDFAYSFDPENYNILGSIVAEIGVAITLKHGNNKLVEYSPGELVKLVMLFDRWHPLDLENDSIRTCIETVAQNVANTFETNELLNYSVGDLVKLATVFQKWSYHEFASSMTICLRYIAMKVIMYDQNNVLSYFNPKDILNLAMIFSEWADEHVMLGACHCFAKYIVLNNGIILFGYNKTELKCLERILRIFLANNSSLGLNTENILTAAIYYVGEISELKSACTQENEVQCIFAPGSNVSDYL